MQQSYYLFNLTVSLARIRNYTEIIEIVNLILIINLICHYNNK